eukprot:13932610-Alexandrium_andersonii.AAC.1
MAISPFGSGGVALRWPYLGGVVACRGSLAPPPRGGGPGSTSGACGRPPGIRRSINASCGPRPWGCLSCPRVGVLGPGTPMWSRSS